MSLAEEQRNFLDRNGYLLIPDVLTPDQIEGMRRRLDELAREEGMFAGSARQTRWQRRIGAPNGGLGGHVGAVHAGVFRLVKYLNVRWLFPRARAFKADMERWNERFPTGRSPWKALRYEVLSMVHAAAVQEHGTLRICDLVNKGEVFDACLVNDRVMAAVRRVIGPNVYLSSLNYRAAEPGGGLQPLHIDWFEERSTTQVPACNTLWFLDDLTVHNGATRVVAGSQRLPYGPAAVVGDLHAAHPDETLITGKAGSVAIVNGQLWHGGTENRTPQHRRLLQAYFIGPGVRPQLDQKVFATQPTLDRLTPQARSVLGV